MNNSIVTEQQLKSLKLFSYYLQSYGIKKGYLDIYVEGCAIDYMDDHVYNYEDGHGGWADMYDSITEVVQDIVEKNDLVKLEDCENRGTIRLIFDCVERILKVAIYEMIYGSNPSSSNMTFDELDEEEQSLFQKLFDKMEEDGRVDTLVYFRGGGDSGDIDSHTENGYVLNDAILHFLYTWLENYYGGWEINEGSQGEFVFNAKEKTLELRFEENTEEEVKRECDFVIKC